jgi:hypothetical protein
MSNLPEIHEIGKLTLAPGDILVLRNHEIEIDKDQAAEIKEHVRRVLQLPADFPFLVLGRDWSVETVVAADLVP